jgi:hypothetical protein
MDQTVAGLLILALITVSMGGVGLYASWPNVKREFNRLRHHHS